MRTLVVIGLRLGLGLHSLVLSLRLWICIDLLGSSTSERGCSWLRSMFRVRVEVTVWVVRVIAAVVLRVATGLRRNLGSVRVGTYLSTTISLLLGLGFTMLRMPMNWWLATRVVVTVVRRILGRWGNDVLMACSLIAWCKWPLQVCYSVEAGAWDMRLRSLQCLCYGSEVFLAIDIEQGRRSWA